MAIIVGHLQLPQDNRINLQSPILQFEFVVTHSQAVLRVYSLAIPASQNQVSRFGYTSRLD